MRRPFRLAARLALCALALTPPPARAQSTPNLARLRSMIAAEIGPAQGAQGPRIPGLAVAVVHGDNIVWEEGFGLADARGRERTTARTPFYLASVTKVFTGTAIQLLAERGAIDMSKPANAYLQPRRIDGGLWDADAITVQRLADHTAGLTTFNLDCATAAPCALPSVIERFAVIVRAPGESFDYSNLGYGILGGVIAGASRRSYGEFLEREIFQRLGMRDCRVPEDGRVTGAAERINIGSTAALPPQTTATLAASGAFCSAHSLALFTRALLGPVWERLVPAGGVPAAAGRTYNRGWWVQDDYVGRRLVVASGGTSNATAMVRLLPTERLAIVLLANTATGVADRVANAIIDEFVPAVREARPLWTPPADPPRQRRPISAEVIGSWQGVIRTHRGDRAARIVIDASGAVSGSLGAPAPIPLNRGGVSADRVFGLLPGNLDIEEAMPGTYELQLGLGLRGTHLAGFATTTPVAGAKAPALSFLVDLTRASP
jgi:CubicO group peptidase (beta-lactamase class C family)